LQGRIPYGQSSPAVVFDLKWGADMGTIGLWHWIIVTLLLMLYGVPIATILGRLGYSKWWTIMFFIPLAQIIALWAFAYSRWPIVDRRLESQRFQQPWPVNGASPESPKLSER
jgi:hypothetical protein